MALVPNKMDFGVVCPQTMCIFCTILGHFEGISWIFMELEGNTGVSLAQTKVVAYGIRLFCLGFFHEFGPRLQTFWTALSNLTPLPWVATFQIFGSNFGFGGGEGGCICDKTSTQKLASDRMVVLAPFPKRARDMRVVVVVACEGPIWGGGGGGLRYVM